MIKSAIEAGYAGLNHHSSSPMHLHVQWRASRVAGSQSYGNDSDLRSDHSGAE